MSARSILVTGASGFIGRRLVRGLRDAGQEVHALVGEHGDIAAPATLKRFETLPLDHVYHLAGRTFVPDAWREPAEFQRVNFGGTLNVLELCRARQAGLTYVSAYLYGEPQALPVAESHPLRPNNPYALSKHLAEQACGFYAAHYGVPVSIVRPFNIYGPGQKGHFLVPEIVAQVLAGGPIRLKDLAPRRDYLHVDDLVTALLATLDRTHGTGLYNIGYGSSLSVAEIVYAIQAAAGTALPVISAGQRRDNEIMDVYADIAAATHELGWHPHITFQQGVSALLAHEQSSVEETPS